MDSMACRFQLLRGCCLNPLELHLFEVALHYWSSRVSPNARFQSYLD
jgi:hypothetical protein